MGGGGWGDRGDRGDLVRQCCLCEQGDAADRREAQRGVYQSLLRGLQGEAAQPLVPGAGGAGQGEGGLPHPWQWQVHRLPCAAAAGPGPGTG